MQELNTLLNEVRVSIQSHLTSLTHQNRVNLEGQNQIRSDEGVSLLMLETPLRLIPCRAFIRQRCRMGSYNVTHYCGCAHMAVVHIWTHAHM